jgi:hypothetical protein
MSDIYLQITETPAVVTLSQPVVASVMVNTVTVANVVSVNVVTMPAITVQAAAPSVTTVAGTVTIGSCVTHGVNVANSLTISSLPAISGTVTANVFGIDQSGVNNIQIRLGNDGQTISNGEGRVFAEIVSRDGDSCIDYGSSSVKVSGTVTANSSSQYFSGQSAITYSYALASWTDGGEIYGSSYEDPVPVQLVQLGNTPSEIFNARVTNSVTIGSAIPAGTNRIGVVTIGGGTVTIGAGTAQIGSVTASMQAISILGVVKSLTYQDIAQVAHLNVAVGNTVQLAAGTNQIGSVTASISGTVPISISSVTIGNSVTIGSLPAISGTVTANISGTSTVTFSAVTGSVSILGTPSVTMGAISGTVTANISGTVPVSISSVTIGNTVTVAGTVTANVASTTVTVSALPSGALTTRFGSVTTANTAQITTAVTNTSRKYLLAQNISTGTVTIGIGFSPTTTQGIQLTAGAGLTFDSFVPTGAVYWLGATTGAAYTILEG